MEPKNERLIHDLDMEELLYEKVETNSVEMVKMNSMILLQLPTAEGEDNIDEAT